MANSHPTNAPTGSPNTIPHAAVRNAPATRGANGAEDSELARGSGGIRHEHGDKPEREHEKKHERHARRLPDEVRAMRQRPVRDLVARVQAHGRLHGIA